MNLQLSEKVAIVTGASRGIGRSIAKFLSQEGMNLVLVARSGDQLNETAKLCKTECLIMSADLRESGTAAVVVEAALQRFGKIDLLVNNAGATKRGDFIELSDEDWQEGFALKLFGAMRLCRESWPYIEEQKGSIINIVGIGGRTGSAEFTIGGSVNAALLNLTKALADRGGTNSVRVNAINPSSIMTERLEKRFTAMAENLNINHAEAANRMSQKLGVDRFGYPDEIAAMVAFLASEHANYCHGTIIDIDGGKTHTL